MDTTWSTVEERLASVVEGLLWGQFVVVEHAVGLDPDPYAQVARSAHGYYCEVVSERYLPTDVWPIDVGWLRSSGWCDDESRADNWWRQAQTPAETAAALVAALRFGRACSDADAVRWWTGTFPSGPGGGEEIDDASVTELAAA